MFKNKIHVDKLIEVIEKGGTIKTGIDIFNAEGLLLLEKDLVVNRTKMLENLKANGVFLITIIDGKDGGIWDKTGLKIELEEDGKLDLESHKDFKSADFEKKIDAINVMKKEASFLYKKAKEEIKKVHGDIRDTGGQFDQHAAEKTVVELTDFLKKNESAFSYLTKEIFSFDEYLFNHCLNTCTIGTAILNQFNLHFQTMTGQKAYSFFESLNISIGFFLHDIGKLLLPEKILCKKGRLTRFEFNVIKTHSYKAGVEILEKNNIQNRFIQDIIMYHHAALYENERSCYPDDLEPLKIPAHVIICKLADIYDAMTSKKCYQGAFNPVGVVTQIFRKYAKKNEGILQHVLLAFVKGIGIYPPGSVVSLLNNQLAYVVDGSGPIIIPFTDQEGSTLTEKSDPIDLGDKNLADKELQVNIDKPLKSPIKAYKILPDYLKKSLFEDQQN